MLFTCLPEGAQIPGRFPGPAHARGKWFTVDIHCHVLTPKAEEMVAGAGLTMDWQPRHQFANEHTKEVNREQARRTRIQFTSVEKRLEDMDRMGIDIQAITPSPAQTFYSVPADLGIATARVINDNLADICGKHPDRFVGLGTVPFQAPELAVAELERLHKSLGLRGIEIATNVAGADLSEPRFRPIFARAEELGLVLFMHPTGFPVPRPYGLCDDDAVIGSMFYVMQLVDGRIIREPTLAGVPPAVPTAGLLVAALIAYLGVQAAWRDTGLPADGAVRADTAKKPSVVGVQAGEFKPRVRVTPSSAPPPPGTPNFPKRPANEPALTNPATR